MEHVSSVFHSMGSSGSQAMVSSEAMVSSGSQADLFGAKHRRSSLTMDHHMDHYWYTRAIGNHDPAEQCKPEIGILLWRETRVVGMALVSLLNRRVYRGGRRRRIRAGRGVQYNSIIPVSSSSCCYGSHPKVWWRWSGRWHSSLALFPIRSTIHQTLNL